MMKLTKLRIQNYRSIIDCSITLSPFVCIVGENNAGKSTILLALSLFFSGSKLSGNDYYDVTKEITIEVTMDEISEDDINRILLPEHREKISNLVKDGHLSLTQRYNIEGSSELRYKRLAPSDQRFKDFTEQVKGKSGVEVKTLISGLFPEHSDKFIDVRTQGAAKSILDAIIKDLPIEQLVEEETSLPTGLTNNTFKQFLPEPIFIPAVKDVTDEVKTKESATLGKLISVLLKDIEKADEVQAIISSFQALNAMLNRTRSAEGAITDNRLSHVKQIETLINDNLKESFPDVQLELEIPPPNIKEVFSTAQVLLDDGVKGSVESKGDGLKRSVIFSLLRSYVQLKRIQERLPSEQDVTTETTIMHSEMPYLFLFEEPELFLHPAAQRTLFEALVALSEHNQVVVTTHSPLFFSPNATGTFVKIKKTFIVGAKPFAKVMSIDLFHDMPAKDAFQLICYENNSAAFFATRVLLVEGDSDLIFLKHVAKVLNSSWDFDSTNIPVIKINGKSNVKRFKAFFEKFGIDVHVLLDLDALIGGFELLEVEGDVLQKRTAFLEIIDGIAQAAAISGDPDRDKIKEMFRRYSYRQKYDRFKEIAVAVSTGKLITTEEILEIDLLFSEEVDIKRREVLSQGLGVTHKMVVLSALREKNIYILSKGVIEDYYPSTVTGQDKPTKALNACRLIICREDLVGNYPTVNVDGIEVYELEAIFNNIFT